MLVSSATDIVVTTVFKSSAAAIARAPSSPIGLPSKKIFVSTEFSFSAAAIAMAPTAAKTLHANRQRQIGQDRGSATAQGAEHAHAHDARLGFQANRTDKDVVVQDAV